MQEVVLFLLVSSICQWILVLYILFKGVPKKYRADISRLLLLDDEANIKKEISMLDKTGILIGRSGGETAVDLILPDEDKQELVALEHAVLNYIEGIWYLEALHQEYATGLKKSGKDMVYRLKVNMPYRIEMGDIIFISHHKLTVR